jgi:dihydrofolate synthase / folylpolyglutamate synthase
MLAAALQANGYKTGLFTSPHLVSYTERMKINGVEIDKARFVRYFQNLWPEVTRIKATFFEATTAIAFQYFRDEQVEIAVIETGLGGRLDATNILEQPLATVITSIGLEHTEILGDTLEKIAYEKACIFKPSVSAIVNAPEVTHDVFSRKAQEVGAPLFFVNLNNEIPSGLSLQGKHQAENYLIVQECLKHVPLDLDNENSLRGIAQTQKLTGLRARLEEYPYPPAVNKGIRLFLDVAHNPHGFERIKEYFIEKDIHPIVIAGFAKDKDVAESLNVIKSFASHFVAVSADMSRSLPAEALYEQGKSQGLECTMYADINDAVNEVISMSNGYSTLLLTGSHYVIGEFLSAID